MKHMRWFAAAPLGLGLVLLFVGVIWTEWLQASFGLALCVLGAMIWRVAAGRWPSFLAPAGP